MNASKRTGTAAQLIARLQELVREHGDLPVYADDPDTGWRLPIGVVHRPASEKEEWPERIEIKSEYDGRPKGDLLPLDAIVE